MSPEEEKEPKNTDPGIGRDVGDLYPEEQPGEANPSPPRPNRGGGGEAAPGTAGDEDSDPAGATGNPGAAGGQT